MLLYVMLALWNSCKQHYKVDNWVSFYFMLAEKKDFN